MSTEKNKPSFRELRERYGIDLEHLIADTPFSLSSEAIERFDLYGEAEPWVVNECLESLSRIAEATIAREDISGIRYILSKDGRATPSAHTDAPLPAIPTMQDLHDYYFLHLRSLVDLTGVEAAVYASMLARLPVKRSDVVKVLRVISDFAGVEYTLDNVKVRVVEEEQANGK